MNSHDTNVRTVSDDQAHALAAAIASCEADPDGDRSVAVLATRTSAILGAVLLVFCRRAGTWSEIASRTTTPFASGVGRALNDAVPPDASTVRRIGGEDWTLLRGNDRAPHVALAIAGDWTLAAQPLLAVAALIRTRLDRAGAREAGRAIARLQHRMMHRLLRVAGLAKIGEAVLWHAAAAVDARVAAIAVTAPGQDRASIVATLGYPLALVEHMQIEPGAGVIGTVMQSGRPIHETGIGRSGRARRPRYHTTSFVAVPVLANREVLGVICVTDKKGDRVFSSRDVVALRVFAAGAALALARERAIAEADGYARAAAIDQVTGLFNRRYLQNRLDEELQRSRRHQIPIALLLLDVDDFKTVNDSYGHLAGDSVLRDMGEILRSCVRIFDVCARFGGEEFVIVMPGGTTENAFRIAERIRQRVEAHRPSDVSLAALRITVSIGFTVSTSRTAVNELLDLADQALYAAKRAGKNCIRNAEAAEAPAEGTMKESSARLQADAGTDTRDGH
jgi:diguanylate cyclase (GGDEF)-like protein